MYSKYYERNQYIKDIRFILVLIWLISFVICLFVSILEYTYIPNLFINLLNYIIETFAPTLTIILTFIFSDYANKKPPYNANINIAIISIFVSIIYCVVFIIPMIRFYREIITASEAINFISQVRPKLSFLVVAMTTYYFTSRK